MNEGVERVRAWIAWGGAAMLLAWSGGCGPGAIVDPGEGPSPTVDAGATFADDDAAMAAEGDDAATPSGQQDAGPGDVDATVVVPPIEEPPEMPGFLAPTDDPCFALTPTMRGTDGADTIRGTDGPDVIFAGAGDDTIYGNGGDDVICAGGGADEVYGGAGHDYIDAGFGRDVVDGGTGDDTIHGRSGGDVLRGGVGHDVLFGDLLDDHLYGDDGDDILIGGHGIDVMHGGEGDDWLRGDTNRDELTGGAGVDTVSFMTTTPPGQPLGDLAGADGVLVDNRELSRGFASGDGYREALVGVEVIVGSAFGDNIVVGPGTLRVFGGLGDDRIEAAASTVVDGGDGTDACAPVPCDGASVRGDAAFVGLSTGPRDLGLVVLGRPGAIDDALAVSIAVGVVTVRATDGAAITAGAGCRTGAIPAEVRCVLPSELRYIVGYGGDGDDAIVLEGGGFPRDMTATLDGGEGDDQLTGHTGQDILFAGRTGNDTLLGHDGDDALLSESMDADVMDAGGGNDQLVANYPCAGHRFVGGPGVDVGGFARVGTSFDTAAERHRQRIHAQLGFRAHQPAFCPREAGTQLANDIEVLEGAGGDDELIGNDEDNVLWGWGGDDVFRGLGGDDTIEGHLGNDTIYGGPGRDRLRGNGGFNVLYAQDGERDAELSCGSGGRVGSADAVDPSSSGCN